MCKVIRLAIYIKHNYRRESGIYSHIRTLTDSQKRCRELSSTGATTCTGGLYGMLNNIRIKSHYSCVVI